MKLRDYQIKFCSDVTRSFAEYDRVLGVMPTGAGKTICFAHMATTFNRTLVVAHREELIEQAVDKIAMVTGVVPSVEMGDRHSDNSRTVVASVQSMVRRCSNFDRKAFDLIVADECHYSLSDSWQDVLTYFDAKVLGVTATPSRGDHRNLGEFYQACASEVSLIELINKGYLCKIKCVQFPVKIDLNNVRISSGDFMDEDVDRAVDPYLRSIAKYLFDTVRDRKTLVFLPLIKTSQKFTAICREAGLDAVHIDGTSEDRKSILGTFSDKNSGVLCNSSLLTHGVDIPSIDTILCLRPTKSQPLYQQIIGRGTRIFEGKDHLLIVDPLWLSNKHTLVSPANLVCNDLINSSMMCDYIANNQNQTIDLLDLVMDIAEERERKIAEELESKSKKKERFIDPIDYAISIRRGAEVSSYEPVFRWEKDAITPKQAYLIQQFGISPHTIKSKGHASKIIGMIMERRKNKLATPKQVVYLRRLGHPNPMDCTIDQASTYIGERWR